MNNIFNTTLLLRMGSQKSVLLLLGFLMMARLGLANTRYVDSTASGNDNGASWTNAYNFLSDALAEAQSDVTIDTILVAQGTYYPTGLQSGTNRESVFAILRNNLKIFGGFQSGGVGGWMSRELPTPGNSGSILSGDIDTPNDSSDNSYHVVAIFAPSGGQIDTSGVILDGFTITGGNGIINASGNMTLNNQSFNNHDGAGIYIGAHTSGTVTSPTISHCVIKGNRANYGGGIYQANYGGLVSAVVDACFIIDNVANSSGAGVFIQYVTNSGMVGRPVIKHTVFESNQAGDLGGGLFFNNNVGQLNLRQVVFRNNIAHRGGGVFHLSGKITVDSCSFYSNVATNGGGGGWYNDADSAILSSVRFFGNIGQNQNCSGGGFRNEGGNVVITDAVFKGNHADSSYAGAWYNEDATVFMTNAIFSGNKAMFGGAWFSEEDSIQIITNTTFCGNLATGDNTSGGAIRTSNKEPHLNVRLRNSILWGNSTEIDGSITLSNTIVSGGVNGGVDENPLFVAPASFSIAPDTTGDYHLNQCSPAINSGNNDSIPAGLVTDLDGNVRTFNAIVDMGAYEYQDIVPEYTAIYVDSANGNDGNDGASWATAFKTLSYALAVIPDPITACYANVDSVLVAQGTYYPTGVQSGTNRDSTFLIPQAGGIKLYGGYPSGGGTRDIDAYPTILSGDIGVADDSTDNSYHVMVVANVSSIADSILVDGFRIINGNGNDTSNVILNGIPVTRNSGGGICIREVYNAGKVIIKNSSFSYNRSRWGGAFYNKYWTGGQIINCLIYGNYADEGGGIRNSNTTCRIINTTITDNLSSNKGGGINSLSSFAYLVNSIVYGNKCLPDSTKDNFYNYYHSQYANYCNIGGSSGYSGTGNLNLLPLFTNPTLGDYTLSPCSPLINRGNNDSIPSGITNDLSGQARIYDTIVDMGAYEYQDVVPEYTAIYVDSANGNDGNDGASWATAFKTLSYALAVVQDTVTACYANVDSVLVAQGTYYPTGAQSGTNRDSSFSLFRGGLKLYGGFPTGGGTFSQRMLPTPGGAAGCSILSGNIGSVSDSTDNSRHAVIIVGIDAGSDSLILDGFRIQEGVATGTGSTYPKGEILNNTKGAGIYTSRLDSTVAVIIKNCLITDNYAESNGGGMVANNSSFYLLNTLFTQNQSGTLGGGLYVAGGSKPVIRNSNFMLNKATKGGGIYFNTGSTPVLENCAILLNNADTATDNGGGGIYNADNASPLVIGCVISGNAGNTGGGWYNDSTATAKLYNVLLSGNSARHEGAAWYSKANDSVWLVNTTIAGNHVNYNGGGSVFLGGSFNNIILQNSIVWNNTSTVVGGLTLANSIVQGGANGGWDWDPQFLVPIDDSLSPDTLGNYRLSDCSPALNAGDSALLPSLLTIDLDGQQRIVGANVDLGAYELSTNPYVQHVLYVDSSITVSGDGSSWSSAMQTLSEALHKAADCSSVDSILIAKGTYYPTGIQTDTARDASFVITQGLKVYGGYAPGGGGRDISVYPSILSGDIGVAGDTTDNSFHVMVLSGIDSTIDSVVVDGLSIVQGMANGSGSIEINNKIISQNKGGGLCISSVTDSMVIFRDCKLLNNYASAGGGGLYISTSGVRFNRIIFAGNRTVTAGGGIYSYQSNPVLINCLVSGNKTYSGSSTRVGGIQNSNNGKVVLINTTVSGNDYGGLRNTSTATFELQNSIVYGNAGFGIDGDTSLIFHSLVEGMSSTANGNLSGTTDPLFVSPESATSAPSSVGDYHVFPCSPTINMGSNVVLPSGDFLDLDRNERVKNTFVDLGAYEYQSTPGFPSDTSIKILCHGDSVLFRGAYYSNNGYFTDTVAQTTGCDSFYVLNLTVLPPTDTLPAQTYDSCYQVTLGGEVFLSDTVVSRIFVYSSNFCDSIYQEIHIHVNHPDTVALNEEICFGDTIFVGSQAFAASGQYQVVLSNSFGCDSVIHLNLQVNPVKDTLIMAEICSGDSYLFGSQTLSTSGIYTDTIVGGSVSGCDSIVTLTLTVNPVYEDTIVASICPGGSYALGDSTYTQAGNYTQTFSTVQGCDSTVTLELNVNSYATGTVVAEICSGGSYLFGSQNLSTSGIYTDTIVGGSVSGCDSIVTLNLTVNQPPVTLTDTIMNCDSIHFQGTTYWSSVDISDTILNSFGCDSVYRNTHLIVFSSDTTQLPISICQGDTVFVGGQGFTTSGTHWVVLNGQHGCDSVIELSLTVNPVYEVFDTIQTCPSGLPFSFGGQALSSSGNYTGNFSTVFGCDSIVHLSFTVIPAYQNFDTATVCYADLPYVLGGQQLFQSGNYTDTFTSFSGCDSILYLNLNVMPAAQSLSIDTEGCGEVVFEGNIYHQSTMLQDTVLNYFGCDSVYRSIHVVVWNNTPIERTIDSLGCEMVYFNGRTYYSDTLISDYFQNVHGCDSFILHTQIHVLKGVSDTLQVSICRGDSYEFGGQQRTQSGVYTASYPFWNGCDSVAVLELTVHELPEVKIEADPKPTGYCIGDEVLLAGSGALQYRWWTDFGKEYGHTDSAIVVLMKVHNVFFLEGKDEWSCLDTAMIELDAGNCCQLFIPNAFTPNGDGRNDKFGVETNGHPKTFRMEIYNRLGQRIYIGYRVEDHWDGLVKGQPAAMGTYYYRVSGICTDDKPFNEKGSFTLIR